jgi:hypothetical protein
MKSYFVGVSDREEGPYAEMQMAQMFADGRIDRNTPCKPVSGGDWKTIDDYLPMLKYGPQLVKVLPFLPGFMDTNRQRRCRLESRSISRTAFEKMV